MTDNHNVELDTAKENEKMTENDVRNLNRQIEMLTQRITILESDERLTVKRPLTHEQKTIIILLLLILASFFFSYKIGYFMFTLGIIGLIVFLLAMGIFYLTKRRKDS